MVTRHRVNLSLSDADFKRLQGHAGTEGKTPSTFALDILKAYFFRNSFAVSKHPPEAFKRPPEPFREVPTPVAVQPLKSAVEVVNDATVSRQQRRAAERNAKKAGK